MNGVLFLLLSALWASCLRAQLSSEWTQFQDFIVHYNKPYSNDSDVFQARFSAFKESLLRQQWLNSYEAENGGSAVYGVNKFSDLTPLEFDEMYLSGLRKSSKGGYHSTPQHTLLTPPKKFDWRDKHVIGRVWNQEQCGSCWAFATVETIGSRYAIQGHHLVELSAQQLISCDTGPELDGCHGGALLLAFSTVTDRNITIVNASTYPFKSGDGKSHTCNTNLPNVGVRVSNFTYLQRTLNSKYNETMMLGWLVKYSPLTVSVNARSWQDYQGGIIQHHCDGSPPDIVDHAVQIVGFDLTGPVQYWIVRNTWGTDWGEDGYVRLKFNHNMCGMTDEVVYVENVVGVGL